MQRFCFWLIAAFAVLLALAACSAGESSYEEAAVEMPPDDCFADGQLADFPWPPPQYSVAHTVPRSLLLLGTDPADVSLMAVAGRLEIGLDAAGYVERSFYGIGCDGFALVTRLEQIEDDGRPVEGGERFETDSPDEPFSLTGYLARLFYAPPGHYRQIIFVVTPRAIVGDAGETTEEELDRLRERGADALTDAFGAIPFTPSHDVTALVYEFRAEGNKDAEIVIPSRIRGTAHLTASGISQAIERAAPG